MTSQPQTCFDSTKRSETSTNIDHSKNYTTALSYMTDENTATKDYLLNVLKCSGAIHAFELSAGLGFTDDVPILEHHSASTIVTSGSVSESSPQHNLLGTDRSFIEQTSWKGLIKDSRQILFLLLLYTVQGIPMGLSASIPFLLQGHVSYKELGIFSLVSIPFSLKVVWAPIVDSLYIKRFGRRKTWLIPVQAICALLMYWGSFRGNVDHWMGQHGSTQPNVTALLLYFGSLYFLMATQDVAVDGWSLTILSLENRSFSSACNAIGQTLGFSIAHVGFLALQDPRTCNRWFRAIPSDEGLATLGSFLRFWSWVVLASTLCACFFPEVDDDLSHVDEEITSLTVMETYKRLAQMATVPAVVQLVIVLLTCRFAFGPVDAATHLKLVEAGVTKEELAFFGPFLLPIGILCPMLIGKLTSGPKPLRWFLRGWKFRWMMSFVWLTLVPLTRFVHSHNDRSTPPWLYGVIFIVSSLHSISTDIMFSSQMAFFARIADPTIGGTYMTLLNTITNVGNKWPTTLSLSTLDVTSSIIPFIDSYTIQTLVFSAVGILWVQYFTPKIMKLQSLDQSDWMVFKSKNE